MLRTCKTPAPWPDRKVSCSRTPTKRRTWNPVWENTQTEQGEYIHGPDCARSNRNWTACWKLQQGGWLHIKLYMAAGNQFTEMLTTTSNKQPRPSATTVWLLPLTRGVTFYSMPRPNRFTHHTVGHLVIRCGATKPPAHPEDGDGVSCWNSRKPSHPDAAVCPWNFHWILLPWQLQDLYSSDLIASCVVHM